MGEQMKFSGRTIEVKTLTVAQVKELMAELTADRENNEPLHVFDLLFDDEVPARAVSKATGLSLDDLAGPYTPQEGNELLAKVRAANPFYVGMMERLVAAGRGTAAAPSSKRSTP